MCNNISLEIECILYLFTIIILYKVYAAVFNILYLFVNAFFYFHFYLFKFFIRYIIKNSIINIAIKQQDTRGGRLFHLHVVLAGQLQI